MPLFLLILARHFVRARDGGRPAWQLSGDFGRDCDGAARQFVTHLYRLPPSIAALQKVHSVTWSAMESIAGGNAPMLPVGSIYRPG